MISHWLSHVIQKILTLSFSSILQLFSDHHVKSMHSEKTNQTVISTDKLKALTHEHYPKNTVSGDYFVRGGFTLIMGGVTLIML